jgi:hypothetical protein
VAVDHRPNHDYAVGIAVGQGSEQRRIDHTEDCTVRADAQGEGNRGDGGEAGILKEEANPELKMMPKAVHGVLPPRRDVWFHRREKTPLGLVVAAATRR